MDRLIQAHSRPTPWIEAFTGLPLKRGSIVRIEGGKYYTKNLFLMYSKNHYAIFDHLLGPPPNHASDLTPSLKGNPAEEGYNVFL